MSTAVNRTATLSADIIRGTIQRFTARSLFLPTTEIYDRPRMVRELGLDPNSDPTQVQFPNYIDNVNLRTGYDDLTIDLQSTQQSSESIIANLSRSHYTDPSFNLVGPTAGNAVFTFRNAIIRSGARLAEYYNQCSLETAYRSSYKSLGDPTGTSLLSGSSFRENIPLVYDALRDGGVDPSSEAAFMYAHSDDYNSYASTNLTSNADVPGAEEYLRSGTYSRDIAGFAHIKDSNNNLVHTPGSLTTAVVNSVDTRGRVINIGATGGAAVFQPGDLIYFGAANNRSNTDYRNYFVVADTDTVTIAQGASGNVTVGNDVPLTVGSLTVVGANVRIVRGTTANGGRYKISLAYLPESIVTMIIPPIQTTSIARSASAGDFRNIPALSHLTTDATFDPFSALIIPIELNFSGATIDLGFTSYVSQDTRQLHGRFNNYFGSVVISPANVVRVISAL